MKILKQGVTTEVSIKSEPHPLISEKRVKSDISLGNEYYQFIRFEMPNPNPVPGFKGSLDVNFLLCLMTYQTTLKDSYRLSMDGRNKVNEVCQ